MTVVLTALPAFAGDFTRDAAREIVTDSTNNLMWQDDATAGIFTAAWLAAITHCEELSHGGYSDWRLPNINELRSIVAYDRYNPAIDSAFQNVAASTYWSSTVRAGGTSSAWYVSFDYGSGTSSKTSSHYVRCVR